MIPAARPADWPSELPWTIQSESLFAPLRYLNRLSGAGGMRIALKGRL